ncbi:gamma-glutamyltranspeptidase / glutathione hydrolase [Nitrosomonas sp. Nm51]|uniref:gamma-glutamyltransferase n=1 Tax=Nitrosomonas sp. Nm51 TaxID=133720 RepID=UPI0008D6143D|nr:gamma-glutamyltransferase [Nitrosomonas sp. Nm51]SER37877.1 gamma-glutamyltranspeptidase / glutathione hydrolase [Nitrosomonas sp. Nm51]
MSIILSLLKKYGYSRCISCFIVWISFAGPAYAETPAAVVSAHHLATSAGYEILDQGGNAFDAAVAVSAALAVVEPYASGLGGGGFWLLHEAKTGREVMIDGRETAPGEASATMYLDNQGHPVPGKSLNGPLAAGIPGSPAALVYLSRQYGQLELAQSLAPAIRLAQEGFKVDQRFAQALDYHKKKLMRYADTAKIFLPNGHPPAAGQLFRQPQLAATLDAIAQSGRHGLYAGPVAQELIRSVRETGGIWRERDLIDYRVAERKPIQFSYGNARITTATLPSAAGLTLTQALNMLEWLPFDDSDELDRAHLIVEVLRLAYKDRVELLGDSDYVQVPVKKLVSKVYARQQAVSIDLKRAGVSLPEQPVANEGRETTHFSILDKDGNRVAATMSINTFFGSGFVAGNTGILLNNEMDDFAMGADVPNVFGLYGSSANAIAPGKRPLSSMSPTFVENDEGILIFGTPGGSRIISMVLLVILDYVNNGQTDPQKLVARSRFHHQYLPDFIQIEPEAFGPGWVWSMRSRGHVVRAMQRKWGNMQMIFFDKKSRQSLVASDPRGMRDTHY